MAKPTWKDLLTYLIKPGLFAMMIGVLMSSGVFESFEREVLNYHFHLRGPIPPTSPIVIVSIDEDSFDELNLQWPWPRSLHAQLIDHISQGHPAAIGLDILFTEPSSLGAEDDAALGEAIERAGNVILAAGLTLFEGQAFLKQSLNPPIKAIRQHAFGYGPVNFPLEDDAFIRQSSLTVSFQGQDLPGFDTLILTAAQGLNNQPDHPPAKEFMINFRGGPTTFDTLSYYRILIGEIPPSYFQGKIVLVGATTPLFHDVYATPMSPTGNMPGVEVHANALDTLLKGDPITRVSLPVTLGVALLVGMITVWMSNRLHPFYGLVGILITTILLALGQHILFVRANLWGAAMPVPVMVLACYTSTMVENFLRERREKKWLTQYFSPNLVKIITRQERERHLVPQRRRVTVLFSDIRDFSNISQDLTPEQTATFLRDYFTEMTEAVFLHGGMVDKYMGDAIMALYNVPLDQPDHAVEAVKTSLEFHRRLSSLSHRLSTQLGKTVTLRCGVGIHTGEAVVGTIGSRQRFEYTAVGETINLGARLESLSKQYSDRIMLSEATFQEVHHLFPAEFAGEEVVKGHHGPLRIYSIAPPRGVEEVPFSQPPSHPD